LHKTYCNTNTTTVQQYVLISVKGLKKKYVMEYMQLGCEWSAAVDLLVLAGLCIYIMVLNIRDEFTSVKAVYV